MKKAIAVLLTLLLAATMLPCALAEGTGGTTDERQTGFEAIKDVPADYWAGMPFPPCLRMGL